MSAQSLTHKFQTLQANIFAKAKKFAELFQPVYVLGGPDKVHLAHQEVKQFLFILFIRSYEFLLSASGDQICWNFYDIFITNGNMISLY